MTAPSDALDAHCKRELLARVRPDGSVASRPDGDARPDSTAWAAIALADADAAAAARARLATWQRDDGRVPLFDAQPEAAWPTSLCVLAWHGDAAHAGARERAVGFLLETTGHHWPAEDETTAGHDTSLRGWPWIQATHSWIEPTAVGMLALTSAGRGDHARAAEASALLLDRMLPGGGWNYGNTTVFGSELRPLPESSGVALHALAGRVERARVAKSIAYLTRELERVRTPFTVGWGVLGLAAWNERPAGADRWLAETLAREEMLGPFDTTQLALLRIAARKRRGLLADGVVDG